MWGRSTIHRDVVRYETAMQVYECNSERGFVAIGLMQNDRPSTPWLLQVKHDQQQRAYYERTPRVSEDSDKDVSRWSVHTYPIPGDALDLETGHPILRSVGLGVSHYRSLPHSDGAFGSLAIIHYWVLMLAASILPSWCLACRYRVRGGRFFSFHGAPLKAAAAISLIFCAALVVLWLRSYWVVDSITYGKFNDPASRGKTWVAFGENTSVIFTRGVISYEYDTGGLFSISEGLGYAHWSISSPPFRAMTWQPCTNWHGFGAVDELLHATPYHFRSYGYPRRMLLWSSAPRRSLCSGSSTSSRAAGAIAERQNHSAHFAAMISAPRLPGALSAERKRRIPLSVIPIFATRLELELRPCRHRSRHHPACPERWLI